MDFLVHLFFFFFLLYKSQFSHEVGQIINISLSNLTNKPRQQFKYCVRVSHPTYGQLRSYEVDVSSKRLESSSLSIKLTDLQGEFPTAM